MPERDEGEGAVMIAGDELLESVDHVGVTVICESLARFLDRNPFEFVDLVIGAEATLLELLPCDLRRPVVDDLVPARGEHVLGRTEREPQRDGVSGLLTHLAHGGFGNRLARLDLALGETHVIVSMAVDEEDLDASASFSPAHGPCSDDGGGGRITHRGRRRVGVSLMSLACRSVRAVPRSERE